jgi:hypothetical protein
MNHLEHLLNQLETAILDAKILNKAVSKANVGWHIAHSLLVLNGVSKHLSTSNPKEYKRKLNFLRILVLTTKKIPRGKGKAPKAVMPQENSDKINLLALITKTRTTLNAIHNIPKNSHFSHPYFGKLNYKQTIKFLEIHTQHHLNIIKDVIRGDSSIINKLY